MELPSVGSQIEGVVLCTLGYPAVNGGKHGLQSDGFPVGKDGSDGVAADGDVSDRRAGDESPVHLKVFRNCLSVCVERLTA